MVSTASKATSIYHPAEVHWAICTAHESEDQFFEPIASTWNPAATAG
jgi:hypothetical protein